MSDSVDPHLFFVRFLSEPGDLVFDPFAGSKTTGAAAGSMTGAGLPLSGECSENQGGNAVAELLPTAVA